MSDLDRLFYWRGVASDYFNYRGEHVEVPIENRMALLKAMGVNIESQESIRLEAYRLDVEPWTHWFPKLLVTSAGDDVSFEINLRPEDAGDQLSWRLSDEHGNYIRSGAFHYDEVEETGEYLFKGARYSRRKVSIGALPPNYYSLNVLSEKRSESTKLAVCPATTYQPEWLQEGERPWGVLIQLYTLKSSRNWGIGDFTDLRELIEILAKQNVDVIGLNPLHALSPELDDYFSPYSPSDRRFINPLYIDPYWIPDFDDKIKLQVDRKLKASLRENDEVDYVKIRNLKYPVFYAMYETFLDRHYSKNSERAKQFAAYVEKNGRELLEFSVYEAVNQYWEDKPELLTEEELSQVDVYTFLDTTNLASRYVLFHAYLQWLAQQQLDICQQSAQKQGMKIGLIRDLAVGADGGGAEVSSNVNLFCRQASVGAPPDPLAQIGQNWGLPPAVPSELRRTGFHHFITLLRKNMENCGALRIDHAMSLMRLWWCPPKTTADHGAYVYYPFPELLGILCLESHLHQCVVIAEDLGVVPTEFREALARVKALSNKVFYFEREHEDRFKPPSKYDSHALAMVNNHDVPTLLSWWNGSDLVLRNDLDLLEEGVTYEDICGVRKRDKAYLLEILYQEGVYPESWHGRSVEDEADQALIDAVLLLVSKSASKIFVIQLEDLIAMDAPVNVPGTFQEHVNWKRKIPVTINEILSNTRVKALLAQIHQQRASAS